MSKLNIKLSPEELIIHQTYNYSMFKTIKGNRQLNPANYSKLLASMKERFLISPILVNEEMEIIDGQHRKEVCEALGYPVFYHIKKGYSIDEVKIANTTGATWTLGDFLELHISNGLDEYIEFKSLIEHYNVSITDLLKVISTFQNKNLTLVTNEFKDGKIEALALHGKLLDFLGALEDFNHFKHYKTSYFFGGFLRLYNCDYYDHARMLTKIKRRPGVLVQQYSIDDYLVMLTRDLYSFGTNKDALYYNKDTKTFHN